jgi:hypothetical protein
LSTEIEALEEIEKLNEKSRPKPPVVMAPAPDTVELPIGLVTPMGTYTTVQVRELNGYDEEAIARSKNIGGALAVLLDRAVTKLGDEEATSELLKELYMPDRVAALVGISRCTWGDMVLTRITCSCGESNVVEYDLKDLDVTTMDPKDASFTVELTKGRTADVHLPRGDVHASLLANADISTAEFRTMLINKCVDSIDGNPVFGDMPKRLSVKDRGILVNAINEVYVGPRFDKTSVLCPDCGKENSPAIVLGDLFPL